VISVDLLLRRETWDEVAPRAARWASLSFRVLALDGVEALVTGENEVVIVPLAGDAYIRGVEGEWNVGGRAHVFEAMPRSLYLPRDTRVELEGHAELALCMARATRRREHDEDRGEREAPLEETYYFRTRPGHAGAFAMQRLYSPRHGLDRTETVRDGDLQLVPHGYHMTAAARGYDLYDLNALAGDRRTMQAADDPDLAWIRPAWDELRPDPRVPMVGR
jgi:5-deoxy-D-glucuronate isomerase